MTTRLVFAGILGLGGLCLAAVLFLRQPGPAGSGDQRVHLADATATQLDTVAVRGRRIEASLTGIVVQESMSGTLWLSTGDDAFPVRLPIRDSVEVDDRLLVVGRLRARGGRRWLEAESWARQIGSVPPPEAGL